MKRLIPIFALFLLAACSVPEGHIIDGGRVIDACGNFVPPNYPLTGNYTPCVPTPTIPSPPITDDDKAAVTRLALEYALSEGKDWFDVRIHESNVVLSTENLDPSWVPQLDGVNIMLLSPEEIQAKANKDGMYLYLVFSKFEIRDNGHIVVVLEPAPTTPPPGEAMNHRRWCYLEYYRENGRWISGEGLCRQ